MSKRVIDISEYQSNIDWAKVKASGVEGAMIRTGYGRYISQKDKKLDVNIAGCAAQGIPYGFYHYSYADTVARALQEASLCLSLIKGTSPLYPVAYDIEDATQHGVPKQQLTDAAIAFCDAIHAAGYRPMVYASASWLLNRLDAKRLEAAGIGIWCAQWNNKLTYSGKVDMWQYSSDGIVPGIVGRVDMNTDFVDYAAKPTFVADPSPKLPPVVCGCEPVPRYKKLTDITVLWNFQQIIEGLMNAGIILGDGTDPDGNDDNIDLSHDMVRELVFNSRAGIYDAAYIRAGLNPDDYR